MRGDRQILDEQIQYYRARAPEYEQWFYRHEREWFAELAKVESSLQDESLDGDILELACGTGLWTRHLVPLARHITAVDASPETLELNRRQVKSSIVEYVNADLFTWHPRQQYDCVFFGFWLSHVPATRFQDFWSLVRTAVKPKGRVFFMDSLLTHGAIDTQEPTGKSGIVRRKLRDGSKYEVIKIYYEPEDLRSQLEAMGWSGYVRSTGRCFYFGCVH